jgi:hypothetical protein
MMRVLVATIVAAAVLSAGKVQAGYLYPFDQSSYTVAPGGTVNVSVYLVQCFGTSWKTRPTFDALLLGHVADLGFEHFLAADFAHHHAQAVALDDLAAVQ